MNKRKIEIAKVFMTIMTSAIVFLCTGIISLAGDINSEEARIIAFYEQVFSYNGKLYVATESAKAAAYGMLIDDRCDLTAAEVDNYILQASGNIGYGISSGYLVPYEEDADTTEDDTHTENTEDIISTEEDGENPFLPALTESDNTEDKTTEDKNTETEGTTENTDNDDENNAQKPDKVDVDEIVDGLDDKDDVIYDADGNKIQVSEIKDTLNKDDKVTIEDYGEGIVSILDKDGYLIYKGSMPVKNTGYKAGDMVVMLGVFIGGGILLGLLIRLFRKKSYLPVVTTLGLVAVILAVYFVGGKSYINILADDWQSVWIGGAPQYEYSENQVSLEADKKPLIDSLYGEVSCDTIGLKAPLYYGDSDDIFKNGVGTYIGGVIPGETGVTLLGGHDTTYFSSLEKIKQGDVVNIKTSYGSFDYKVSGTAVAKASDKEAYNIKADKDMIILYTCYPFGEITEKRLDRFFVYGELISDGR